MLIAGATMSESVIHLPGEESSVSENPDSGQQHVRYKCTACDETFAKKTERINHYWKAHGRNAQQFRCDGDGCSQTFSTERALSRHKLIHLLSFCKHCNAKFDTAELLEAHTKAHHEVKPPTLKVAAKPKPSLPPVLKRQPAKDTEESDEEMDMRDYDGEAEYEDQEESPLANHKVRGAPAPRVVQVTTKKGAKAMSEQVPRGDDGRYLCPICKETAFLKTYDLMIHLRRHLGERPFKCKFCPARFVLRRVCDAHERNQHRSSLTRTPQISLSLPEEDAITPDFGLAALQGFQESPGPVHQRTEVRNRMSEDSQQKSSTICTICRAKFSSHYDMIMHYRGHKARGDPFQCKYCSLTFRTSSARKYHENIHLGLKPFACDRCDKAFPSPRYLRRHMDKCGGVSDSKSSDETVPFEAPPSPEVMFSMDDSQDEMETEQDFTANSFVTTTPIQVGQDDLPFHCKFCGKGFSYSYTLSYHENSHRNLKPYKCDACPKAFPSPARRHTHRLNVHGLRGAITVPEARPVRQESPYYTVNPISRKPRIRLADGKYKCNFCPKVFSKSGLVTHERLHTGERPFECRVCTKKYNQIHHLRDHLKNHHGIFETGHATRGTKMEEIVYEHPCTLCGQVFRTDSVLASHVQTVHVEKRPYHCDVCQRGFFSEANYQRHVEKQLCRIVEHPTNTIATPDDEVPSPPSEAEFLPPSDSPEPEEKKPTTLPTLPLPRWFIQSLSRPLCYRCDKCNVEFTREALAAAHRKWHREHALTIRYWLSSRRY